MADRAVSTVLGYTLTIGISAVLIVGLLGAGSAFVDDQRAQVVDAELTVIGERLAADIATADRLARSSGANPTVVVVSELPDAVAGSDYRVTVRATDGNASLELSTRSLDRSVVVPVANTTAVASGTVGGGTLSIAYDASSDRLEVENG